MMDAAEPATKPFNIRHAPPPGVSAQDHFAAAAEDIGFFRATEGWWVFTSYDMVREALQTPEVFSSRAVQVDAPVHDHAWIPLELDPPDHTKYRQLLAPAFTPARTREMEPMIRTACRAAVERVAKGDGCEFMGEFATQFPTGVFQTLLGIPSGRNDEFVSWVQDLFHGESPEVRQRGQESIYAFFGEIIRSQQEAPGDNLIGFIVGSKIDGRDVTYDELLEMAFVLFIAGHDTVPNQLGYVFRHLAAHPEDRRRLLAEPQLMEPALEEFLRHYTISAPGRYVATDMDFHGCPLAAGDRVVLNTMSANRDSARFPDGDTFVIDRKANPHYAFGGGPHRCLGSHLARAELRIAIEEWHLAIPDYRIAEGATISDHGGVLGIDALPLLFGSSPTEGVPPNR